MRVLLINANRFKQPWPVIPFGLCCVAASVEKAGHEVKVLDLCFSKSPAADIQDIVQGWRPDVVGVSIRNIDNSAGYSTLFLLEDTKLNVIAPLKNVFKGPIVIGGPSVGISGAEMLDFLDLQYAIRGDGETAMVEFLKKTKDGLSLRGLGGLVIRENGHILEDNPPFRVENLDTLPPVKPQRYINLKPYQRFDSPLQVQTKRGCALKCSYCTYNRIEGGYCRLRDPKRIADEIEELVNETGINHIEFTDSTFNIPLHHTKAVLKAVIAKKMNLRLRTMGLNPGAVDEELADLIKEAGFRDVDLGVESGSNITLKGLGKSFRKKDVLQAGKLLQERKIPTTWYLLVGAPGETYETLQETFATVNKAASKWDLINIGVGIRVYKGAPIAEQMKAEDPNCTYDNFLHPVHFKPNGLSLKEVKIITKRTALRHPNYFMYDEDENTPTFLLMIGASLLKLFAPMQPLWKLHIIIRKLQNFSGIGFIKKLFFDYKHRGMLNKVLTQKN
jgi:radical SAM superfamily enzyme YgiQ (UPF0313 family)